MLLEQFDTAVLWCELSYKALFHHQPPLPSVSGDPFNIMTESNPLCHTVFPPRHTYKHSPASSGSYTLTPTRGQRERLWQVESWPTHTCFPFLRLKYFPENPPPPQKKTSFGGRVSQCFWVDKNHQRESENYQICSPAIVSFSTPQQTMDF